MLIRVDASCISVNHFVASPFSGALPIRRDRGLKGLQCMCGDDVGQEMHEVNLHKKGDAPDASSASSDPSTSPGASSPGISLAFSPPLSPLASLSFSLRCELVGGATGT